MLEDAVSAHGYVVLNTGEGTYQTYHGSMTHTDVSLVSNQLATKGNVQQHDGILPHPDHYNNQRTPVTTTFYCTEVEIRRGRLERVPPLHRSHQVQII